MIAARPRPRRCQTIDYSKDRGGGEGLFLHERGSDWANLTILEHMRREMVIMICASTY